MWVSFDALLAVAAGSDGRLAPVAGSGQIFALADTSFTTPLPLRDNAGVAILQLASSSLGFVPEFQADIPDVDMGRAWFKSGPYVQQVESYRGLRDVVSAVSASASLAALSSAASSKAATDALVLAGGVTSTQIDTYLGGVAEGLVNTVAGKAVLDPATGKLRTDQLPPGGAVSDATNTDRGVIRLAGDLAGSADVPTVIGLSGKATDMAVIHKTGAETVAGVKTFTSAPVVPDASFAIAKVSGLQAALDSGGGGGLLLDSAVLTNEL